MKQGNLFEGGGGPYGAKHTQPRRTAALRHFHPRDESPAEALAGERRAAGQDQAILEFFMYHAPNRWTPSEVYECLVGMDGFYEVFGDDRHKILLTSVRRALTNLTKAGKLRKHSEDRRPGPHGAKECTWSLVE